MNIFTIGQRNRMRALFAPGGVRRSFIENPLGILITGPATLCSSETYTLTNLPTGVTVTGWSADPGSAVNISGSGSSVTVSQSENYSGAVTLQASIDTDCGTVEVKESIYVGFPLIQWLEYANAEGDGSSGYLCSNLSGNTITIVTDSPTP